MGDFKVVSSIILAGLWAAAPGCPSPAHHQLGLCSWPLPVGRAVRGCGAIVRAGRRQVGPGVKVELEPFRGLSLCLDSLERYSRRYATIWIEALIFLNGE